MLALQLPLCTAFLHEIEQAVGDDFAGGFAAEDLSLFLFNGASFQYEITREGSKPLTRRPRQPSCATTLPWLPSASWSEAPQMECLATNGKYPERSVKQRKNDHTPPGRRLNFEHQQQRHNSANKPSIVQTKSLHQLILRHASCRSRARQQHCIM